MPSPPFYMYIIECSNEKYYTGSTHDIEERWRQHMAGEGAKYTKKYPPVRLVYVKEFPTIFQAREGEAIVKKWSQKKKRKLISGEWM